MALCSCGKIPCCHLRMYQLIYAIYPKIVINGHSRDQASRSARDGAKAHDAVETAYPTRPHLRHGWTSDARIEADEAVQPLALKETADVAGKRKPVEDDAEISRGRPWLTLSGSIVEKGRQLIAIVHRADESGPGANSPVIGMRKPETLLGFADDWGR
jgi:hypothetical protein